MKIKVDVLLPHTSQYGVLHHFSQKVYEALLRLGVKARLLDKNNYTRLLFDDPPTFSLGFNGAPRAENGEFLCDQALVPHVACLVDPPYRFIDLQTSSYIFVTSDDRVCVDLFNTSGGRYYFLPHGVEPELDAPTTHRPLDVAFLGSFLSPEARRKKWEQQFPLIIQKTLLDAAEWALQVEGTHFMEAFFKIINEQKAGHALPFFDLGVCLQELELYVKGRDRMALIRSITASEVHIFGSGVAGDSWDLECLEQKNIKIHPSVSFQEALAIMQKAKIVLNSGIKSVYGAHERVFSGIAAGAAVMTSSNPFIHDHFKAGESILVYRHHDLLEVDEQLSYYLTHEEARQSLVQAGRALVMRYHTWDARLKALLPQILKQVS